MSLHATTTVEVSADISLRVPRGESENLTSGVADVLESVEAVTEAAVDRVTGVRPCYTDIRVDADVTVELTLSEESDPASAAATRLADGFGITSVDAVERTDPV